MSDMPSPRTPCAPSLLAILDELRCGRFDLVREGATQADIAKAFEAAFGPPGEAWIREHRFGQGERVDFWFPAGVAVEVKVKRSATRVGPILRQLARYAAYPQVETLVLASGRSLVLPPRVEGKRLHAINLGRAWL